jgi:hypothetical protein
MQQARLAVGAFGRDDHAEVDSGCTRSVIASLRAERRELQAHATKRGRSRPSPASLSTQPGSNERRGATIAGWL